MKDLTLAGLVAVLATVVLPAAPKTEDRVPVLLELFTSEGCASCPPADRLLATLDETQPFRNANLIVLSEHVDYWDGLGWRDPYSSPALTERQRDYGRKFNLDTVYTPQLVVDGQFELVGSDSAEARKAIEKAVHASKAAIAISVEERKGNQIPVHVNVAPLPAGAGSSTVFLALAESRLESKVLRGENSGRLLAYAAVVRTLAPVGSVAGGASFDKEINLPVPQAAGRSLRIVAFVQDKSTGRVVGSTQHAL